MTWPQAFLYAVLALLAAPLVYFVLLITVVLLTNWIDEGFPRLRKAKPVKPVNDDRCHDPRCPAALLGKHKCHDLSCKKHPHSKAETNNLPG